MIDNYCNIKHNKVFAQAIQRASGEERGFGNSTSSKIHVGNLPSEGLTEDGVTEHFSKVQTPYTLVKLFILLKYLNLEFLVFSPVWLCGGCVLATEQEHQCLHELLLRYLHQGGDCEVVDCARLHLHQWQTSFYSKCECNT